MIMWEPTSSADISAMCAFEANFQNYFYFWFSRFDLQIKSYYREDNEIQFYANNACKLSILLIYRIYSNKKDIELSRISLKSFFFRGRGATKMEERYQISPIIGPFTLLIIGQGSPSNFICDNICGPQELKTPDITISGINRSCIIRILGDSKFN